MKEQKEKPTATSASTSGNTILIVNPSSSGGATGENWDDIYTNIKGIFGENPEVAFSKKPGSGTTLAREYLKKGFKNIVAIGGDGTINEVANGFFYYDEDDKEKTVVGGIHRSPTTATTVTTNNDHKSDDNASNNITNTIPDWPTLRQINPDATFGIISSGTRNVLARSLNLPAGLEQGCQSFVDGKLQKIDVIGAIVTDPNDHLKKVPMRIFLNAAEIGVAAEIIDRSKKIRDKVKSRFISTVSSMVATMPTYQSNLCEISVYNGQDTNDNNNILTKMTMCIIANGKYLGGGLTAAPQASVSDGLLDIVILKDSGSVKMLKELASMKKMKKNGGYTGDDKDILYMKAKGVSIKSKEENKRDVTVTVDGEPIGILPASFRIYKNALTVKM
jgi:diacylglycerol kinase family enzyme